MVIRLRLLTVAAACSLAAVAVVSFAVSGAGASPSVPTVVPQADTDPGLPISQDVSQTDSCAALLASRASLVATGAHYGSCVSPAPTDAAAGSRMLRAAASRTAASRSLTPAASAGPRVVTVPDWCGETGIVFKRFDSCGVLSGVWDLYEFFDDEPPVVVGAIDFNYISYQYDSEIIGAWANQIQVQEVAAFGEAETGGFEISGVASCEGACTEQSSDFPPQPSVPGEFANGTSFFGTTALTQGSIGTARSTWTFQFSRPDFATIVRPVVQTQVTVRCDTGAVPGLKNTGCVHPDYYPPLVYALSGPYPTLAQHIIAAQISGLPGAYGSGTYLNRLVNETLQDKNRATACPAGRTNRYSANWSCDEYPFASTTQGAFTGGGAPRTFPWCGVRNVPTSVFGPDGYSVCGINYDDNTKGGSALGTFYQFYRIIDNDRFSVWITP